MESHLYLSVFVLWAMGTYGEENQCGGKPADVVFVLDTSSSIPVADFRKQLRFVEDVVDVFDIAPSRMRVGLLLFSDKVYPKFSLRTHTNKAALKHAISSLRYQGGSTHTNKALAYVRDNIFKVEARAGVPRVTIVMTDGMSYNMSATTAEARAMHAQGIAVFVVGIGNGVDHRELSAIASDPDSTYLRQLESFDLLDSFKKELALKACKVKYQKPEPPITPNDQGHPQCDVTAYFGLDTSGVSTRNTQRLLEFLTEVTSRLTVLEPNAKTLQLMSECPATSATAAKGKNYAGIYRKLRLMAQLKRRRSQHKMVAVLLVDSVVGDVRNVALEVIRSRFSGVETVVVTVGSDPDLRQIASILHLPLHSQELRNHLVSADSFYRLGKVADTLADVIASVSGCK